MTKVLRLQDEFEQLTIDYLKNVNLNYRKSFGQYFTPKSIREELLKKVHLNQKKIKILDPACGTGEFLLSACKYFKNAELYGWDIDEKLINISKKVVPKAKFETIDSLTKNIKNEFKVDNTHKNPGKTVNTILTILKRQNNENR